MRVDCIAAWAHVSKVLQALAVYAYFEGCAFLGAMIVGIDRKRKDITPILANSPYIPGA